MNDQQFLGKMKIIIIYWPAAIGQVYPGRHNSDVYTKIKPKAFKDLKLFIGSPEKIIHLKKV